MPRLKDDAKRIRDAIEKLGHQPTEAELATLAKRVNVNLSRAMHVARQIGIAAEPKRALRAIPPQPNVQRGRSHEHSAGKERSSNVAVQRQPTKAVESRPGRTDD